MDNICSICNKPTNAYTKSDGQIVCMECASNLKKQQILEQASKSDDSSYFKDWSSKDRTTAFFEAFGHYVKEPNKRDFDTVYHIWLWSVHDDKALAETIKYTLKWANMTIHNEYKRWNP